MQSYLVLLFIRVFPLLFFVLFGFVQGTQEPSGNVALTAEDKKKLDAKEIARLARYSYQVVNTCRGRLGCPKFTMSQWTCIMGLTDD